MVGRVSFVDEYLQKNSTSLTTYELKESFPNPFNQTTNIRFILPRADKIRVSIINILGKEIKSLYDNHQLESGLHSITWDGTNDAGHTVSSGLYLIRFQTSSYVEMKGVVFIK